ncbi:myxococcus cysteine-rich repeat containing protein [Nannocystis pusilla]|uniref:myxococcus cysteine-rich repeat containing protein n=1 Tax=Nannocystis pusilla TaxID=889268 RepID=UPI003B7AA8A0
MLAPRGDRFALRYQHDWTLWSMATGKVLRVLEVGDATRGTFLVDGSFVAVHHHDLWLWDPEPLPAPTTDSWIAAAPHGQYVLVAARNGESLHMLARADASTRSLGCPIYPDAWAHRAAASDVVLDERGRVLVRTHHGEACLQDETGATRMLAADGKITAIALARHSDDFAVGLEDGRVLLYGRTEVPLAQWQLAGPLERLWALTGGTDLIAATREGQVVALRSGRAAPLSLGTLREPQEIDAIAVATHPYRASAVIGLPRADQLLFYAASEVASRPAVLLKPNLAYSPSGAQAAITLADRRLLVVNDTNDPGREIALPEEHDIGPWPARLTGAHALQFVEEDTLEVWSGSSLRVRVDLELGEAFVLERETSLGSLGLGLRAQDSAELLRELGAWAEVMEPVPKDRHGSRRGSPRVLAEIWLFDVGRAAVGSRADVREPNEDREEWDEMRRMSGVIMVWLASACVDRPIDQSPETGPPGQEGTSAATSLSTSTDDPPAPTTTGPGPDEPSSSSTAEPTSSTTSTSETEASCGDGQLDPGEVCDDGNPLDGDGCNIDCDVSGRLLWQRLSGATGRDTYHDVVALPDGRIFVGGAVHPAGGTQDRWLLGLDPTGAPTWERRLDAGDAIEQALAVAADEAGLYAAGSIAGDDDHDLWIGRFALDGAMLWEDTVSSGLGPDLATDLTLLPSAGMVVAGRLATDVGPALWLRSYSQSGQVQWTQTVAPTSPVEYPLGPGIATATDQLVAGFIDADGAALLLGATFAGASRCGAQLGAR